MTAHHPPNAHPAHPPQRRPSLFLRLVALAALCCFVPIFAFGATVAATGTMQVRVTDKTEDFDLWIPVPALLLDVAVLAAPSVIPAEDLADARAEIEPYLPTIRSFADELERMPSATLVEVRTPHELVRIAKAGRNFEIEVDSDDAHVQVTLPARLLSRSLDLFD